MKTQNEKSYREILKDLHENLLNEVKVYRRSEARLLSLLEEMDAMKGYFDLGYGSLYEYSVHGLKLTEGQASAFIQVARKSRDIPELKRAIEASELSVSKIKRMAVVLNRENANEWIQKAQALTTRELETEVARSVWPKLSIDFKERLSQKICRVSMALSVETFEKLESAKALLEVNTYEGVLEKILGLYLEKKDPVKKAARILGKEPETPQKSPGLFPPEHSHSARNVKSRNAKSKWTPFKGNHFQLKRKRIALTARLEHLVNLRDQGLCQHRLPDGKLCNSRRYIHLHHIKPICEGGMNTPDNLMTLCSSHHRLVHNNSIS